MTVLLYGKAKDIVGTPSLSIPTSNISGRKIPTTVGDLKIFLEHTYPGLKSLPSVFFAVNHNYAKENESINLYDEIAMIPSPN